MENISGTRWNQLIDAVNNNIPKEQVYPPITGEYENKVYDNMVMELSEMRKVRPNAAFWPVEIEYDDESLDIYAPEENGKTR